MSLRTGLFAVWALSLAASCGDDDARVLSWRVTFEDEALADRARVLEAQILEGGCEGTELWATDVPLAGPAPAGPPELSRGRYGFAITVVDESCVRYADGCTEIDLPRDGDDEVVVPLVARVEMPLCSALICNAGICTVPDGGIPECPDGTGDCNGDPVDGCETSLDSVDHCGGCGQVCQLPHAMESCAAQVCAIAGCEDGWADCDSTDDNGCEQSLRTADDCGACGAACNLPHAAETCASGRCELVACHVGWEDCDGTLGNGCEANLRDPLTCGACDTACTDALMPLCSWSPAASACVAACAAAETACGMSCVDVASDPDHCGACGTACTFDHGIGSCGGASGCMLSACEPLFSDCDSMAATGCETALDTLSNCGTCGSACTIVGGVTSCVGGDCNIDECFGEFGDCNGDPGDGCEADLASALTCGSCEMSCDARNPACGFSMDGRRVCVPSCTEPAETQCGDRCLDTDTDLGNCGSCGSVCTVADGAPRCTAGECLVASCDTLRGDCDGLGANGCETDLQTSLTHCGTCGAACSGPDARCIGGECMVGCPEGMGNCDDDSSNGCETPLNTLENCGGCGSRCDPPNGTGDCASGTCDIVACETGFDNCDGSGANGCESRTGSDPDNCGSCGNNCRPPRCCSGMCC